MSKSFHDPARRHPRCPQCHYDLVATVAANKRICPECGYEFTPSELSRAPRPGDWTPGRGVARASLAILLRALIMLPLWAAFIWLLTPVINMFPVGGWGLIGGFIGVILIIAFPALLVGHVLSRGLTEIAGMQSLVIVVIAFAFAIGVIAGGVEIADAFRDVANWKGYISTCAAGLAGLWIVRNIFFET